MSVVASDVHIRRPDSSAFRFKPISRLLRRSTRRKWYRYEIPFPRFRSLVSSEVSTIAYELASGVSFQQMKQVQSRRCRCERVNSRLYSVRMDITSAPLSSGPLIHMRRSKLVGIDCHSKARRSIPPLSASSSALSIQPVSNAVMQHTYYITRFTTGPRTNLCSQPFLNVPVSRIIMRVAQLFVHRPIAAPSAFVDDAHKISHDLPPHCTSNHNKSEQTLI